MANRNTNPALWDKEWFMRLSERQKLLIKYIWEKCDNSGVWSFNSIITSTHLGRKTTEVDIESLPKDRLEKLKPGKYFFPDFLSEQIKGPLMHISRGERKPNNYHVSIYELLVKNGLGNRLDENGYIKNSGADEGLVSPSSGAVESNSNSTVIEREDKGGAGGKPEIKPETILEIQHPLQLFAASYPALTKMEYPFTFKECQALAGKYPMEEIQAKIEYMANLKNPEACKKYKSIYLCVNGWLRDNYKKTGTSKAGPGTILNRKDKF